MNADLFFRTSNTIPLKYFLCWKSNIYSVYSPEKTPNAEMTRNGDVAETMKAAAVVIDVNNIAIAERLKSALQTTLPFQADH